MNSADESPIAANDKAMFRRHLDVERALVPDADTIRLEIANQRNVDYPSK